MMGEFTEQEILEEQAKIRSKEKQSEISRWLQKKPSWVHDLVSKYPLDLVYRIEGCHAGPILEQGTVVSIYNYISKNTAQVLVLKGALARTLHEVALSDLRPRENGQA